MSESLEYTLTAEAIDMFTDFFVTSSQMYCLPLSLLMSAGKLGMVNTATLKRKDN